ncbi:hypothetical protein A3O02_11860 [Mycobacteroides abscessus]|nr:hypothetical protein A3O02_11860 [Mycobacteroides abscessus]
MRCTSLCADALRIRITSGSVCVMHTTPAPRNTNSPPVLALADRLFAFDEVAGAIHQSIRTVYTLTDADQTEDPIPTVRIGRKRLVRESDLAAWLDRRYTSKPTAA